MKMEKLYEDLEMKPSFKSFTGNLVNAERVMVLSPHHDDESIGCGGTILRYLKAGAKVLVVYLTDGRYGLSNQDAIVRKVEAIEAWKDYEIEQIFLDIEDTKLSFNVIEALAQLVKIFKEFVPDIVYTPWVIDRHPDHQATNMILAKAICEINYDFLIAFYEIMIPLYANHIVNITEVNEGKTRLLEAYKSQHTYLNIIEISKNLNLFRASTTQFRKIKSAEGFLVTDKKNYMRIVDKII